MSKLMMFDFRCTNCQHVFEDLVQPLTGNLPCVLCGHTANRVISPVRIDRTAMALSGSAGPESIAHFDRIHREKKAIEDRSYERHGDYGPGHYELARDPL
jgi:hypothetical protein